MPSRRRLVRARRRTARSGFELFRDYLLTLDYPQNQLRVATGQLPDVDGQTVLNYFLDFGAPHIEIDLAGRRVRAQTFAVTFDQKNRRVQFTRP